MNELTINNLNFSYRDKKALSNINLTLNDGLIALLGPNGAGKSTLIKLLVTLFESNNATIYLNELEYIKDKSKVKSQIGYVPQDFDMYKNITGKDYLDFVAKMKYIDKSNMDNHINKVVSDLDLMDFINKKIGTYSGGVKRRLGIAQAIIGDPTLVVMDEPTVGLDPEQRNEFRRLLPSICQNRIVLISTHIVEDIQFNCDKLIVINEGHILYDGVMSDFIDKTTIYSATISNEQFNTLPKSVKIIDFKQVKNGVEIKYISDCNLIENSIQVQASLQDAYIHFLNKRSINEL